MTHDDDRAEDLIPPDHGVLFADELSPKTQEAFMIVLNECRRQAALRRNPPGSSPAPKGRAIKAHLKLVQKHSA